MQRPSGTLRYLFGPGNSADFLREFRRAGRCLVFGNHPDADLPLATEWNHWRTLFPAGWEPDLILVNLAGTTLPEWLWQVPVPIVGIAEDSSLYWSGYRRLLPRCEAVLADAEGAARLRKAGLGEVLPGRLYGCEPASRKRPPEGLTKDIDVLYLGNLHAAVRMETLPLLGTLSRLGNRRNVAIRSLAKEEVYWDCLHRARCLVTHDIRGGGNRVVVDAALAGTVALLQEGNELLEVFEDGRDCLVYRGGDALLHLLDDLLDREEHRSALARLAAKTAEGLSTASCWEHNLRRFEEMLPRLRERRRQRPEYSREEGLLCLLDQAANGGELPSGLVGEFAGLALERPRESVWSRALAMAEALTARGKDKVGPATVACERFLPAARAPGATWSDRLNLVEALVLARRTEAAAQEIRTMLAGLADAAPSALFPGQRFPPGFDPFRVAWERAGWRHAGDPGAEARAKADLLDWRLHHLLGTIANDAAAAERACERLSLGIDHALAGRIRSDQGELASARDHLATALIRNPFDRASARCLKEVLEALGERRSVEDLCRNRRLLCRAAPEKTPPEAWFADPAEAADHLTSIVILCCNGLEDTRLCLESILQNTAGPYELILVDNGSTDGTGYYLRSLAGRSGPRRVEIIANPDNRGYPAGCNQGWAAATGRSVLFLNNDTVVPPGWLEGLVHGLFSHCPDVGMVGAVSNQAPPPQHVAMEYGTSAEMEDFARRHRQRWAGRSLEVRRLSGFCFLIRRELLERLGGMDERFGVGFFEDDDLCLRVHQAGYRLLLMQDVFVHHTGNRTFTNLGLDTRRHLLEKFALFREKWGPAIAARYRLPEPSPGPAGPVAAEAAATPEPESRRRVSLVMIVRDEEANLPGCLECVADLVDEIVVIDTGSRDETVALARKFGAQVHSFAWVDDFAAARNAGIERAGGDWIFWMDADDRLDEENRQRLRRLFAGLRDDNAAYMMRCLSRTSEADGGSFVAVDHARLFRRHPAVRWRYRVHEQILLAVRELGGAVRQTDIVIHHLGYGNPDRFREKHARNLRLLEKDVEERPDDPYLHFYLGWTHLHGGRPEEAAAWLRRSLATSPKGMSTIPKAHALLVQCLRKSGLAQDALAACREAREQFPEDPELLFLEAGFLTEQGDLAGAEDRYRRLLGTVREAAPSSLDAGLAGYKTRHNLALILQRRRKVEEAETCWKQVLLEMPEYRPALLSLGELYLASRRTEAAAGMLRRLRDLPGDGAEGAVLEARILAGQGDFAGAQRLLEERIREEPESLLPRVVLYQILQMEDRNPAAIDRAFRAALELDPANPEIRRRHDAWRTRTAGAPRPVS